jgi:hypothetical protein
LSATPTTNARREEEDALTGQTGSGQARLTLRGARLAVTTRSEWSPAERFASGSAPHSALALGATRPSVEWQSVLCPVRLRHHVSPTSRSQREHNVLTTWEVPVKG